MALGNLLNSNTHENVASPVINATSLKFILSIAVKRNWQIRHIDIKTAFLNADIQGNVYTTQPAGYQQVGKEGWVMCLKKALYGLKQSSKQWYIKVKDVLMNKLNFTQSLNDSCVYFKHQDELMLIIGVYVDDFVCIGHDLMVDEFADEITKYFTVSDKGKIANCLSMQFDYNRNEKRLVINQQKFIEELLIENDMNDCKPNKSPMCAGLILTPSESDKLYENITEYQSIVGSLIYLAFMSRMDIAYVVSRLCSYMAKPYEMHMKAAKQVLRYLKGTKSKSLIYSDNGDSLMVCADANFVDNVCTSGCMSFLYGNLVNWISRKQSRVATSTCEAEILSIQDGVNESEFLRNFAVELDLFNSSKEAVLLLNDNVSAIKTVESGGKHDRNKHYKNRINRITRALDEGVIKIEYRETKLMLADCLTKPLLDKSLSDLVSLAGLKEF